MDTKSKEIINDDCGKMADDGGKQRACNLKKDAVFFFVVQLNPAITDQRVTEIRSVQGFAHTLRSLCSLE